MVSGSASSSILSFRGCESVDCGVLDFNTMHYNLHFCGLVKKCWTSEPLKMRPVRCCENSGTAIERCGVPSHQDGCLNASDISIIRKAVCVCHCVQAYIAAYTQL
jgi:hypothetical protein